MHHHTAFLPWFSFSFIRNMFSFVSNFTRRNQVSEFPQFPQQHSSKRGQNEISDRRSNRGKPCFSQAWGEGKNVHKRGANKHRYKCRWKPYKFLPPGDLTGALQLYKVKTLSILTEHLYTNQTKRSLFGISSPLM